MPVNITQILPERASKEVIDNSPFAILSQVLFQTKGFGVQFDFTFGKAAPLKKPKAGIGQRGRLI